jgi:Poly A polymerase head domain
MEHSSSLLSKYTSAPNSNHLSSNTYLSTNTNNHIKLNDLEVKIFDTLLQTIEHHKLSETLVLRVAGGWVRDKLLGLESNDIDIALDSMLGFNFAEKIKAYLDFIKLSD